MVCRCLVRHLRVDDDDGSTRRGESWLISEMPSIRYSNPSSTQLSLADSLSPIKTDLQPISGAAGQRFSLEAEAGGSSACVKVALLSTASERW